MCYLCNEAPCHMACPHFVDSSLQDCAECGSYICEGDKFYDLNGYKYHRECISMLTSTDILEILEIEPQVVSGE